MSARTRLIHIVLLALALFLTASPPVSAAKPAPSGGGSGGGSVNLKIQGFDKTSQAWSPGNTGGYAETESIPFRVILANSSTTATVDSLELVYDHERGGVPGIEDLNNFQLCTGAPTTGLPGATQCQNLPVVAPGDPAPPGTGPYVVGPTFTTASGTTQGVYTVKRLTMDPNKTYTILWGAELALGSHAYNGSALHMQIGAAAVNGATVNFGSKDVPIPVNQIIATTTDKKINGSDGPVTLNVGDVATVTITANTFGLSRETQNLTITDELPPCADYVAGSASPGLTSSTPDPDESLTWVFNNVSNRSSVTVTFQIKAVQVGDCTNLAVTTSNVAPPSDDEVPMPVAGKADVTVDKNCTPDIVGPGGTVHCTLNYKNEGNAVATNVRIEDVLDAGLTYVAGSASPAPTSIVGQKLTWDIGTLAVGAGGTISYDQKVPNTGPAGQQSYADTATIFTSSPDSDPGDNTDTEITKVTYSVDLSLSKQCPASVTPGTPVQQKLVWANNGTATATGVTIVDTMPAGMSYQAGSGSVAPQVNGQTLTWTLGTVTPKQSGEITYNVVLTGSSPLTNSATISSNEADADSSDNTATCTSGVAISDVFISKACPQTSIPGATATHTLTFGNEGNLTAQSVTIVDTLSAGLTYAGNAVVKINGQTANVTPSVNGQVITFNIGSLAAGSTGTITYSVSMPATAGTPGVRNFSDTAVISTTTAENDKSDNSSGACTTSVDYQPNLTLTKSACPTTVVPGGVLTYTLTYKNTGSAPARSAVLTDNVPTGTSLSDKGGGTLVGSNVTWNLGDLAPGASGSKSMQVVVTANGGSITNTATLTSPDSPTRTATTTTPVSFGNASTSGKAYPLDVRVLGGLVVLDELFASQSAAPGGPAFDNNALLSNQSPPLIPGVLQVGLLNSASASKLDSSGASSTSYSEVASINLLGGLVRSKTIRAVSSSTATAFGGSTSKAGSTIEELTINGVAYANVAPGTKIDVLALNLLGLKIKVAEAYVLEETKTGSAANSYFTVTHSVDVLRVRLLVPFAGLPAGVDIRVGHAESRATYPQGLACGTVANAVGAEAFTAFVSTILGTQVKVGEASIIPLGGTSSNGVVGVVPGVVGTGTVYNFATGNASVPSSRATSHVEDLNVLGGLVTANVIDATSTSPNSTTTNLGLTFVNLKVAGIVINLPVAPNTTITIPQPDGSLVTVILNEQHVVSTADGKHTWGEVNAVHVYVLKATALATEVIVGSARSEAHLGG